MREIKFRAWDKTTKRMLSVEQLAFSDSGDLISVYTNGPDFSNDPLILQGDKPDLNEVQIEQYTGIKDQKGVSVYEGDILLTDSEVNFVEFIEDCWATHNNEPLINYVRTKDNGEFEYIDDRFEVIGNIHQNPGLLEAEK